MVFVVVIRSMKGNEMNLPYAEDINYWQTSGSSPDQWVEKTKKLIQQLNGKILAEAFGSDSNGNSAFMIAFQISDDQFKVLWPVLPTKTKKDRAARIQAATFLYHDIKAKCLSSVILGARAAFFSYLMLPDGRTAMEVSTPELISSIPELFSSHQLPSGNDFIEGDYNEL